MNFRTQRGAPVRISHRLRPSRSRRSGILADRRPAGVVVAAMVAVVVLAVAAAVVVACIPTGEKAGEKEGEKWEKSIYLISGTLRPFATKGQERFGLPTIAISFNRGVAPSSSIDSARYVQTNGVKAHHCTCTVTLARL